MNDAETIAKHCAIFRHVKCGVIGIVACKKIKLNQGEKYREQKTCCAEQS
jgi:hypothetical protein